MAAGGKSGRQFSATGCEVDTVVLSLQVYDDQGRRRFHGAFTGGFSAGYYNTVGSKEGWTPSTFRSSRKDKEKGRERNAERKVEDFMDEEDLADLREGRGALRSSDKYGEQPLYPSQQDHDPLLGMLGLQDPSTFHTDTSLSSSGIHLSSTSLGTRVLQHMGWKPGQGLGPRISARRKRELQILLGQEPDQSDPGDENHLLPPPDTALARPLQSKGTRGLGWEGSERPKTLDEVLQRDRDGNKDGKKTEHGRSGFGIGALEQDSDSEEDVYAEGLRREESTLARRARPAPNSNKDRILLGIASQRRPFDVSKVSGGGAIERDGEKKNTWHDGRPMIAGFRIAQQPPRPGPWFDAPPVPKGWQPDPQRVWSQVAENVKAAAGTNLGPKERASILGEARIPGPPPVITDYLSAKSRERLERAKLAASSSSSDASPAQVDDMKTSEPIAAIPHLDASTAKAALAGFIPFGNEPEKQQRYRDYLLSQAEPHRMNRLQPGPSQSAEQFVRELSEFARSAAIFKPMSVVMASRFESSTSSATQGKQMEPGLYIPERRDVGRAQQDEEERNAKDAEDDRLRSELQSLTPARRNARMGLFGPKTTREVKAWKPSRLLCKRFNVPMPYPEEQALGEERIGRSKGAEVFDEFGESNGRTVAVPSVNARWEASKKQLQQLAATRAWEGHGGIEGAHSNSKNGTEDAQGSVPLQEAKARNLTSGNSNAALDLANVGLGENDEAREETTYVKPPLGLFKAIFAEDDGVADVATQPEVEPSRQGDISASAKDPLDGISHDLSVSSSLGLPRPTFVPLKRQAETNDGESNVPGKLHKLGKRKKRTGMPAKKQARGMLTFNLDDEDAEVRKMQRKPPTEMGGKPSTSDAIADEDRKQTVQHARAGRPRASDLFD